MAVQHPRTQLAAALRDLIPKTWDVITSERNFDAKNRTVVILKQSTVARAPGAPIGARTIGFTITLTSRFTTDLDRAEDDLDGTLPKLLGYIESIPNLKWTTATKVSVNDTYLGYDIPVEIPLKKENL